MVDPVRQASHADLKPERGGSPSFLHPVQVHSRRLWKTTAAVSVAILLLGVGWAFNASGSHPKAQASTSRSGSVVARKVVVAPARQTKRATTLMAPPVATTTTTSVVPVKATPVAAAAPVVVAPVAPVAPVVAATVVPPSTAPSVAALVAEVEAEGVEPGSNWSWSMGDTATHCGAMTGAGTGCTYGSNYLEYTVFSGSPTLALVAHELANAEVENDAVPSLLNEVAAGAGGR